MPPAYHDDAFITSWTDGRPGGSELLTPFGDPGQDLMHLELVREGEFYVMHSTKIAEGFNQPIDAEIIANNVYVLDFAGDHMIWEVAIGQPGSVPATRATAAAAVPNPCADRCRFVVDARTDADLTIDVFDILGRPVRRVHEGRAPAGPRRLTLDVSTLPAGAYTVRVAGGGVNEAIPVRVVH
jgi:hypothetical protein